YDASRVVDPLRHTESALTATDRYRRRIGEIEEILAEAPPKLDHVTEPFRADEACEAPGVLEHRVRGHGRAEHNHVGGAQELPAFDTERGSEVIKSYQDPDSLVVRSRRRLRRFEAAGLVGRDEVGERPADIDPDLVTLAQPGRLSTTSTSTAILRKAEAAGRL